MELNQAFDPNQVPEDDNNFEPIPIGDYQLQVIDSKIEDTKTGTGQMLVLTLEVIKGQYANRRIWDRLNIVNQNPDAQRIAQRALADLCLAIGLPALRNTEELHFRPFTGRVGIRTDKTGQYGPQNTVRYKQQTGQPPTGKGPSSPTHAPPQATAKPQQTAAARPWANKPAA